MKLITRVMDAIALGSLGFILGYNFYDQTLDMNREDADSLLIVMFVGFVLIVVLSNVIKGELSKRLVEVAENTK